MKKLFVAVLAIGLLSGCCCKSDKCGDGCQKDGKSCVKCEKCEGCAEGCDKCPGCAEGCDKCAKCEGCSKSEKPCCKKEQGRCHKDKVCGEKKECGKDKCEKKACAVLENIMTRVSVRQFTEQKPSEEQIQMLLKAAMAAPTGRNLQPWKFIVVDDKELLKSIGEQLPYSNVANGAQVCIVPCGDVTVSQDMWVEDVSAATENILLAAHAMGLGAVWTAVHPFRTDVLRPILNIPENLIPLCVIPVGYPADANLQPKDKFKPENIQRNAF